MATDFNSPEFQIDLYRNYASLRSSDPVHQSQFKGSPRYSLLRYDDVLAGFRDPRLGTSGLPKEIEEKMLNSGSPQLEALARLQRGLLVVVDPPDHTRLRNLVSKAFTPRQVSSLRTRVEEVTSQLLDNAAKRNAIDLIADFAVPLPLIVIAELLGVPTADLARLKTWSAALAPLLDRTLQAAAFVTATGALLEAIDYFGKLLAARRTEPRDDLLSALIAARDARDSLSEDELMAICFLVLGAGHETTTNLIGNGMLALLQHPSEFERLRAEPELLPSAVEELLRIDSPVQRTVRRTLEEIEIGGVRIPEGKIVDLVIGAANRDPDRFADPDHLDLERAGNRHMAFGEGIHFCVGAALARLEGEIAFGALTRRFPAMKSTLDSPDWRPGSLLRGQKQLPVRL